MMCVWLTCENESWSWDVVSVVLHSSKCLRSLPAFKTCCKSHLSLCTFWAKTRANTTIHILQFSIMFLNCRKSWHQHRLFISFILRNLDWMLNLWSQYTIIHQVRNTICSKSIPLLNTTVHFMVLCVCVVLRLSSC